MKRKAKACRDCELAKKSLLKLANAYTAEQVRCAELEQEVAILRKELESDDVQMGKQRDRLIRLTEISKQAEGFAVCVARLLNTAERTDELNGRRWFALIRAEHESTIVQKEGLVRMIAALDVDTAVPPRKR